MRVLVRHDTKRGGVRTLDISFYHQYQQHNAVGPSRVKLREDKMVLQQYRIFASLHREDGPANLSWHDNGLIKKESWYKHNRLWRDCGPAYLEWYGTGVIKCEKYMVNNQLHATGKPALVNYDRDGTIYHLEYRYLDKLHHDGGYAYMHCNADYTKYAWYINGRLHNGNEPAFVRKNTDGTIDRMWYFNGFQFGLITRPNDKKPHWIPNYDCTRSELDGIADWISKQSGDWFNPTPDMVTLFQLTWCKG